MENLLPELDFDSAGVSPRSSNQEHEDEHERSPRNSATQRDPS
jgi:hypothetical protein